MSNAYGCMAKVDEDDAKCQTYMLLSHVACILLAVRCIWYQMAYLYIVKPYGVEAIVCCMCMVTYHVDVVRKSLEN